MGTLQGWHVPDLLSLGRYVCVVCVFMYGSFKHACMQCECSFSLLNVYVCYTHHWCLLHHAVYNCCILITTISHLTYVPIITVDVFQAPYSVYQAQTSHHHSCQDVLRAWTITHCTVLLDLAVYVSCVWWFSTVCFIIDYYILYYYRMVLFVYCNYIVVTVVHRSISPPTISEVVVLVKWSSRSRYSVWDAAQYSVRWSWPGDCSWHLPGEVNSPGLQRKLTANKNVHCMSWYIPEAIINTTWYPRDCKNGEVHCSGKLENEWLIWVYWLHPCQPQASKHPSRNR